jgi:hypothetical protein
MIRLQGVCLAVAAVLALAACGQKDKAASARKADVPAWQASGGSFVEPGWKAGDQASWEAQLRNRAQGQNEYAKTR